MTYLGADRTGGVSFWALGRPKTKGSTKFVPSKHGGKAIPKRNPKLQAWQGVVAHAAGEAGVERIEGGVMLDLRFYFARPKGHFGTGRNAGRLKDSAPKRPISRSTGDLDKLVRAVLDALTGIAFADDSEVVKIRTSKRYVEANAPEGVRVQVRGAPCGTDWEVDFVEDIARQVLDEGEPLSPKQRRKAEQIWEDRT